MRKIDRLGWAEGISFKAHGLSVGIRATQPGLLSTLVRRFPPGSVIRPNRLVDRLYSLVVGGAGITRGVFKMNLLYADAALLHRSRELEPVLDSLETDLQFFVAEAAKGMVFVHAGVVAWQDRAIVIAGRSGTGKSTLVSELVRAGALYYSDEFAVLDRWGRVHPYPIRLSLRAPGELKGTAVPVEAMGVVGTRPLRLGLVMLTRYRPNARWRPERITKAQGALQLLANTLAARREPAVVLATLRKAVNGASILKGRRGEASDVARAVLATLESWPLAKVIAAPPSPTSLLVRG